jgi:hemerythrin-like metal-binding protein
MSKTETYLAMQSETPETFQAKLKADLKDVGVARFNADHTRLLNEFLTFQRLMDDFRQNKINESGWNKVEETLNFLTRYAEEHLTAEEAAMRQANYKDYISHEAMHSQFRNMLTGYREVVKARDESKIFGLKYDLFDWFFNHINNVDVKYSGLI